MISALTVLLTNDLILFEIKILNDAFTLLEPDVTRVIRCFAITILRGQIRRQTVDLRADPHET